MLVTGVLLSLWLWCVRYADGYEHLLVEAHSPELPLDLDSCSVSPTTSCLHQVAGLQAGIQGNSHSPELPLDPDSCSVSPTTSCLHQVAGLQAGIQGNSASLQLQKFLLSLFLSQGICLFFNEPCFNNKHDRRWKRMVLSPNLAFQREEKS